MPDPFFIPPDGPLPADRELGRRMARISQAAGIGYWSVNRRLRQVYWSPELRALHGLQPDDPLPSAKDWLDRFVHPDDRQRSHDVMRHWFSGKTLALAHALRVLRPDGSMRELLTHSLVETDEHADVRFGVVIDVTPLRRAEQALRQAEGRAALTARAVGMGTWEVDLETDKVHWDIPMWLLRGLAPRSQPLSFDERLALVHPEDRERMQRINHHDGTADYEFRVVWPDGQVRWLASQSTTLHDELGRPQRRIGVNWDVSAPRRAEAALRDRELALRESQTRHRTLARMSHELRTPLNAILGCAHLLQAPDADPGQSRHRLAEIEAAGQQLLRLVDRVLDLTGGSDGVAAAPAPAPAASANPGPGRTVLYIEDNTVNAMIVSELIARRGDLAVVIAETGLGGLAQASALQPALVLLDMQLPDIDGAEVFRRLRANPRTAALPCIALSANVLQTDIDAALAAGMTAYWTKPLDFGTFARSLDAIFGPASRHKVAPAQGGV